ncbi:DUF2796 domain-containing protein [Alkalimonas collagenimarina]|uniref:DUF2796 domain-containing protein n=1 Tax=Alkalimonas collagenimarina TaxID=400390 RepID=A0ABT9H0I4_9GAMM|nr:DUF2796 domain-containing protein [Alkalimonas collagenimarina]MDP4536840.1 DUF2796 domain-containing protein [Alkalimonas collagenimarina]
MMKPHLPLVVSALAAAMLISMPLSAHQPHDAQEPHHEHENEHEHQHQPESPKHNHDHVSEHEHSHDHHDHSHDHDEEFTQMGAHVHGEALLTFVLEGNEAMLALQSAAYNIVGFEHAPSTDEQRQEIQAALTILAKGDWFSISRDAGCQIEQADASTDLTRGNHQGHGDFYANFSLLCHNPARLQDIELGLLQLMPSIERVEVQWILNERQGMSRATLRDSRVRF